MTEVAIIEAYARLKALKEHVPGPHVDPKYVAEFHQVLDLLEQASGVSLASFRIPASEIKPVITSVRRGGGATYSKEPYCDRSLFDMRVDGVLTMFELITASSGAGPKPPIGFHPRKR